MKPSYFSTQLADCNCLADADPQLIAQAQQTTEQAVEEANRFSNPNIPWPLKLTGFALLIYLLTR